MQRNSNSVSSIHRIPANIYISTKYLLCDNISVWQSCLETLHYECHFMRLKLLRTSLHATQTLKFTIYRNIKFYSSVFAESNKFIKLITRFGRNQEKSIFDFEIDVENY